MVIFLSDFMQCCSVQEGDLLNFKNRFLSFSVQFIYKKQILNCSNSIWITVLLIKVFYYILLCQYCTIIYSVPVTGHFFFVCVINLFLVVCLFELYAIASKELFVIILCHSVNLLIGHNLIWWFQIFVLLFTKFLNFHVLHSAICT